MKIDPATVLVVLDTVGTEYSTTAAMIRSPVRKAQAD